MEWFEVQAEWSEDHDYQTINVASQCLKNWFMEMKDTFPPMNGEFTPDDKTIAENENLEKYIADYSIGYNVIYAAFACSLAEKAYDFVKELAKKHDVGFFDVSGTNGDIIMPDGSNLE